MKYLSFAAVIFIIFSCAEKNNGLSGRVNITVTDSIINDDYLGTGFDVIFPMAKPSQWQVEQVFGKRWRELSPPFARVIDNPAWDYKDLDKFSGYLQMLKDVNTQMYITSTSMATIHDFKKESDYVKNEVDHLEYLKKEKGLDNLKYFCVTNELSLDYWASMVAENKLDDFKRYHQLFYDEINRRNLGIQLLSTDASPFGYWYTIKWAADSMDNITGVYGGHHYINSYDVFDPSFYNFFLGKMKWGSALARSRNKKFIMGEFGPKQSHSYIDSISYDAIIYNNIPIEPYAPIQVAEAVLAQMNGGIYAGGYWTFADMPTKNGAKYANKWGIFRWYFDEFTPRPNYFALGLLVKYMHGPAVVYSVTTSDSLVRVAAIRSKADNKYSIAVVNRNQVDKRIELNLKDSPEGTVFRKYVYDPEKVPFNYYGDLQSFSNTITLSGRSLTDTLPPFSLVVYTSDFDEIPPDPVKGLTVSIKKFDRDRNVLNWESNTEDDFCYYRIYRSTDKDVAIIPVNQIASTISTDWMDNWTYGKPQYYYKVVAVDKSGNSSR